MPLTVARGEEGRGLTCPSRAGIAVYRFVKYYLLQAPSQGLRKEGFMALEPQAPGSQPRVISYVQGPRSSLSLNFKEPLDNKYISSNP